MMLWSNPVFAEYTLNPLKVTVSAVGVAGTVTPTDANREPVA